MNQIHRTLLSAELQKNAQTFTFQSATLTSRVSNIEYRISYMSTDALYIYKKTAPLRTSDLFYSHQVLLLHLLKALLKTLLVIRTPVSKDNFVDIVLLLTIM